MRLIKSVLAGIVTLVLAVLAVWAGVFLVVSQVLPRWGEHPSGTAGIGFGSIPVLELLLIAFVVFAAGFLRQWRRGSRAVTES